MKHIWSPWRMKYIELSKTEGCIFCDKIAEDRSRDRENYIIYRGKTNFIILNSYPYNPGHLMVVPNRHVGAIGELTFGEREEHSHLVVMVVGVLEKELQPQGFNLGMNIGKVGGAGVEGHIHTHIVPRWDGDTNFMSVMTDTRVIPEALSATYKKLVGLLVA
ncbi:MAG: HIT domain-containing protein [Dehalococcoidia bacterium]|nr:HIT domain-containing protein [Dehalococcoidia bacterium]